MEGRVFCPRTGHVDTSPLPQSGSSRGTHRAARSPTCLRARPRGGTVRRRRVPGAALLVNSLVLNSGLMLQSSTRHLKLTTGSASRSLRARPFLWPHTQDAGCPCPPHPREAKAGGHAGPGRRMGHWSPGDPASAGPCWPSAVPEAAAAAALSGLEQASWAPRSQARAPPGQPHSSLWKDSRPAWWALRPPVPAQVPQARPLTVQQWAHDLQVRGGQGSDRRSAPGLRVSLSQHQGVLSFPQSPFHGSCLDTCWASSHRLGVHTRPRMPHALHRPPLLNRTHDPPCPHPRGGGSALNFLSFY